MEDFGMKKKILTVCLATTMTVASAFSAFALGAPTPTYFNDFEGGLGTGVSVVGSGEVVAAADTDFGNVYHNNTALSTTPRSNYLLLPSDCLMGLSGKTEGSISFWVNLGTHESGFMWANMFGAYGSAPSPDNTTPAFALETRLIGLINLAGYTDLLPAQNVATTNKVDVSWLTDGKWHLYTATFTATTFKIYVDDVLQNSWVLDGVTAGQVVAGIFTNTADLDYITLGGNQAFNWADKDSSLQFDDFAVYDVALDATEIDQIILDKIPTANDPTTTAETTAAAVTTTAAAVTTTAAAATTAAAGAAVTTTKASNTADNTASTAVLLLVAGVGATFVVLASRKSKVTE
jgi:hypothetical protein